MRRAWALLGIAALLTVPTASAAAKGGLWTISDQDGFVKPGQTITASVLVLPEEDAPTSVMLVPDWDWNNQPRRVPDEVIELTGLVIERVKLGGVERLSARITFAAPEHPDSYGLIACTHPCRRLSGMTGEVFVVEDKMEVRFHKQLVVRDVRLDLLEFRIRKTNNRAARLETQVKEQLGYLSDHVDRIKALEAAADEAPALSTDLSLLRLGGAAFGGLVVGLGATRLRRQNSSAR